AAVAMAVGDRHHDAPVCVNTQLAKIKISLNDCRSWRNNKNRGWGLRRLAIAQLGSRDELSDTRFSEYDFWDCIHRQLLELVKPVLIKEIEKATNPSQLQEWVGEYFQGACEYFLPESPDHGDVRTLLGRVKLPIMCTKRTLRQYDGFVLNVI